MNTKGKESGEKYHLKWGRSTENAHTPAREYYQDSEEKEPKTKAGKGDKNPTRKFHLKQMNRKEGSEAPKQERTSRKGRRKRRAACNDTWSDKTKRRIGKKNAAEQKQKFLKKDRQGRKTKKRKGEANIQNRTSMDGEEKSEQLTSEYGFRNFSRNSLMGEKEEDTEAKTQKGNTRANQQSESRMERQTNGKQKETKSRNHKESKENNPWQPQKQHRTSKKGSQKPGIGAGDCNRSKEREAEYREDTTERSKHQTKEKKPRESLRERQQRGETQKRGNEGQRRKEK